MEMKDVFVMHFFCLGDNTEYFCSFVSLRDRQSHVWMGVETCGDCWMAEESVLIFIYTPVISISLASKPNTQNRPILLAIIILPPTVALLVPYFLLFCLE